MQRSGVLSLTAFGALIGAIVFTQPPYGGQLTAWSPETAPFVFS